MQRKFFEFVLIVALVFMFVLSCKSKESAIDPALAELGLVKLPVAYSRRLGKISSFNLIEYTVAVKEVVKDVSRGRVDLSNVVEYSTRKLLTITDNNEKKLDAEVLMLYKREGFYEIIETGQYFGRTSQASFPFTLSLVSDEYSKIFSGKAKYKTTIVEIEGGAFSERSFTPSRSEINFSVFYEDKEIAYIDFLKRNPQIYIKNDLEDDIRRATLYTLGLLVIFERNDNFVINPRLIRGEK